MEWLKKLLQKHGVSEEVVNKIIEEEKDNQYIPKSRFDEVNEAKKQLENDLKDRDKQLKDLGDKAKGNEELSKQITDLQEANKKTAGDYEAKIRNLTLDSAINNLLKDNKVKHPDLLISKFDREKLKIKEDGSIDGLEEQLTSLKEGYKDLFEQPLGGKSPNNTGGSATESLANDLRGALEEVYSTN